MSAFLDLTDAVVAALAAGPALCDGGVTRGRDLIVPTHVQAAIQVHIDRASGETELLDLSEQRWDAVVGVDLFARATAGQDGEAAIDALLAGVFARMAAAAVPAGVMAWVLAPTVQWAVDEADNTLVQASLVLRVQLYTDSDLELADI